jgi:hypothetical protein
MRRMAGPELAVSKIRDIVGDNEALSTDGHFRKSDKLARMFGLLRYDSESTLSKCSKLTLDEAIEVCLLHSDAYKLALQLFRLEMAGELISYSSAFDALQPILRTHRLISD